MNSRYRSRSGFTLVELAIVLVIVGLLAGGVLVGRDLVKSAEIRGFVNTLNKFNVASSAFRLKYRNLPGDLRASDAAQFAMVARGGQIGHGDGNGIIEGCSFASAALGCETALFWRDLTDSQLTSTKLFGASSDAMVDGTAGGFKLGDYLPPAPFRDNLYYFVYPRDGRNTYYVSRITGVSNVGVISTAAGLTPYEARAIDEKLDDAAPDNGTVQAMTNPLVTDPGAPAGPGVCAVSVVPMTYNSDPAYSDTVTCQISIRNSL